MLELNMDLKINLRSGKAIIKTTKPSTQVLRYDT